MVKLDLLACKRVRVRVRKEKRMSNNQEFFCNHCNRNTIFFLESDMLWYCDDCGNVLDSLPMESELEEDDTLIENEQSLVIRCKGCNNVISVDSLVEDTLCPVCFHDLSDMLTNSDFWDSDDEEYIQNLKGREMNDISG